MTASKKKEPASGFTPAIDLRPSLLDVQDQGRRPTCLPFAVSTAHEHAHDVTGHLSPEFIFYHAVRRSHRNPTRGVGRVSIKTALFDDGQPDERDWPYQSSNPSSFADWSAPPNDLTTWRGDIDWRGGMTFDELGALLDANQLVVMVMHISDAFYRIGSQGLNDDCAQETARAIHAIVTVGYGLTPTGDNAVLIRNSWGRAWGDEGYAWMIWNYFDARLISCGPLAARKGAGNGNAC